MMSVKCDPLQAASGRKCEKCRCPLCMDPNRSVGEPTMHLCHYPNCGKVYKVTGWTGLSDWEQEINDEFAENLAFTSSPPVAHR